MTPVDPAPAQPPSYDLTQAREFLGLVLLVFGLVGLLVTAFFAHPLLGWAVMSGLGVLVGWRLSTSEAPSTSGT